MEKLTTNELTMLYNNFVVYRDKVCNGWAKMDIKTFYNKFNLGEYSC
jgi:hypothetical protein